MKVLHLSAHLGGGVGRTLSSLARYDSISQDGSLPRHMPKSAPRNEDSAGDGQNSPEYARASQASPRHTFVCLEKPQKEGFVHEIREHGCEVVIVPEQDELLDLIQQADILQLEWWNHPALYQALCRQPLPPIRLLVWCHVSGLDVPLIPRALLEKAHRFVLTSPCSMDSDAIRQFSALRGERLGIVSSGAGLDDLPLRRPDPDLPLRAGYLGSLNFAKLHPEFITYLAAVDIPGFAVRIIGDVDGKEADLRARCAELGKHALLEFFGFSEDVFTALSEINCLVYLLNPDHYGTAENALLEAMALGIVPIVLDNSAERCIVKDRVTGLIVRTPREFADAVRWLNDNPHRRALLGMEAARFVRGRYTARRLTSEMSEQYEKIYRLPKRSVDFKGIFGEQASSWFLSCQPVDTPFEIDGSLSLRRSGAIKPRMIEQTKGSIFHFREYFPNDRLITAWAEGLRRCLAGNEQ